MSGKERTARSLWRQPLLHFLLGGAAIFALDAFRGTPETAGSQRIVVSAAHIERLADQWQMTWGRAPGEKEIQALVRNYIKEEIYYREAIKLGLDVNDSVIRQRLGRKMEFLAVPELSVEDASDSELKAFYKKNAERYRQSPVLDFEQVYFANLKDVASTNALQKLRNGTPFSTLGDTIGLPRQLVKADKANITRSFGSEFYTAIQTLEQGIWSGPVASGFGHHLVKITGRQAARIPDFPEVRGAVVNDWLAGQNAALQNEAYATLRATYDVEIDVNAK